MLSIEFLRQFRIGEYAIFDLSVAFLGLAMLSPILSKIFRLIKIDIPKKNWIFLTLPIGIATHLLRGRMTPMTKNFLDPNGHYILKLIVLILLILGLRKIKIIKKDADMQ